MDRRTKLHPSIRVRPSVPGRVVCLCCQHHFHSPDVKAVRVCSRCKRNRERLGKQADRAVEVHDVRIPPDEIPYDD